MWENWPQTILSAGKKLLVPRFLLSFYYIPYCPLCCSFSFFFACFLLYNHHLSFPPLIALSCVCCLYFTFSFSQFSFNACSLYYESTMSHPELQFISIIYSFPSFSFLFYIRFCKEFGFLVFLFVPVSLLYFFLPFSVHSASVVNHLLRLHPFIQRLFSHYLFVCKYHSLTNP